MKPPRAKAKSTSRDPQNTPWAGFGICRCQILQPPGPGGEISDRNRGRSITQGKREGPNSILSPLSGTEPGWPGTAHPDPNLPGNLPVLATLSPPCSPPSAAPGRQSSEHTSGAQPTSGFALGFVHARGQGASTSPLPLSPPRIPWLSAAGFYLSCTKEFFN